MFTPQYIKFVGTRPVNEMRYTGRDKLWVNGQVELTDQLIVQQLFMTNNPLGSWVAAEAPAKTNLRGSLLATDGNSITALFGAPFAPTSSDPVTADSGWVGWGLAYQRCALRWVEQRAVSGATTEIQRNLFYSWMPNTQANHLFFMEGTNSINAYVVAGKSDIEAAQLAYADLLNALAEARSYNKFSRIILGTILPRIMPSATAPNTTLTTARNAAHSWYNTQVRKLVASDGLYTLVDFWKIAVGNAATGAPKANFLRADDGLHPTPKGCRAMGKEYARVINAITSYPESNLLATSDVTRAQDPSALFINSNPMFAGTPVTADTTTGPGGTTGVVIPGWRAGIQSGTATMVASVGVDSDGYPCQILTVSGASAGAQVRISSINAEGVPYVNAGDYLKFTGLVKATGMVGVSAIQVQITVQTNAAHNTTGFLTTGVNPGGATNTVADYDNSDFEQEIMMFGPASFFAGGAPTTVLAGGIFVTLAAGGTVTLRLSRAGLVNLGPTVSDF